MILENKKLLAFAHRGQISLAEIEQFRRKLQESQQVLDGQVVPTSMKSVHWKASLAHARCYESALLLRASVNSDGRDRIRLLREADKEVEKAQRLSEESVAEFGRIWRKVVHP